MARPEKEAVVEEMRGKFSKAAAVVLADYRGLNVGEVTELRKKLRESGVEYRVVKNTLSAMAAKSADISGLDPFLEGPTAFAFGYKDPVAAAKVLHEFAKNHKNLKIKGGLLNGEVIAAAKVKALADLPSREELLARVVGSMAAPMTTFARLLGAPVRNLGYAFEGLRKARTEA